MRKGILRLKATYDWKKGIITIKLTEEENKKYGSTGVPYEDIFELIDSGTESTVVYILGIFQYLLKEEKIKFK